MVRLKRRSLRQLRKDLVFLKNIRSFRFGGSGEELNEKPKKKRNWAKIGKIAALVGGGVLLAGAAGAAAHQGYKRDVGGVKTNTEKHIEQIKTQVGVNGRKPAAVGATGEHIANKVAGAQSTSSTSSISKMNPFSKENQAAKAAQAQAAADAQIAAAHAAAEAEKAREAEAAAKAKAERLAATKAKLKSGSKEVGKASLEAQARLYTTIEEQRVAVEKNPALAMIIARQNRERAKAVEVANAEIAEKRQRQISEQKNKSTNWKGNVTPETKAADKAKTDKEVEKTKQETILAQQKINKLTADSYRQQAVSKAEIKAQNDAGKAKIAAEKQKAQQELDAQQAKIEAEKQKAANALQAKQLQLEQKQATEKAAMELKELQEKAAKDLKEQQKLMKEQAAAAEKDLKEQAAKAAKDLKEQQLAMKDAAAAAKKLNNTKKEITTLTPAAPAAPATPSAPLQREIGGTYVHDDEELLAAENARQLSREKLGRQNIQKLLGFGKRNKNKNVKKNVKKVSSLLKKKCKKYHIRLTITRNGKRVPKSEKMLIKQLKKCEKNKK